MIIYSEAYTLMHCLIIQCIRLCIYILPALSNTYSYDYCDFPHIRVIRLHRHSLFKLVKRFIWNSSAQNQDNTIWSRLRRGIFYLIWYFPENYFNLLLPPPLKISSVDAYCMNAIHFAKISHKLRHCVNEYKKYLFANDTVQRN